MTVMQEDLIKIEKTVHISNNQNGADRIHAKYTYRDILGRFKYWYFTLRHFMINFKQ